MHEHWREFGYPVHIQLARFLSTNQPKRPRMPEWTPDSAGDFIADMMAMAPGGSM